MYRVSHQFWNLRFFRERAEIQKIQGHVMKFNFWFYLLGHLFSSKFRLMCSQWFFKVLRKAWDLKKEAFKKIFKSIFSACVSTRIVLTKLSKLLMTHHLGSCPKKFFQMNFQISWIFLCYRFQKVLEIDLKNIFTQNAKSQVFLNDFQGILPKLNPWFYRSLSASSILKSGKKSVRTNTSLGWKMRYAARSRIKSWTS